MPLLTILLALATAGLLLPAPVHAGAILQAPTYVGLSSGLVGFWSFDGKDIADVTAYDRSGQGNNGALTNGPTRVRGKLGQALKFDGVDDYVNVASSPTLDTGSILSISAWFKLAVANDTGFIVDKMADAFNDGWSLQHVLGDLYFYQNISSTNLTTVGAPLTTNWHHVVVTINGAGNNFLYLDGTVRDIENKNVNMDSTATLKFGAHFGANDDFTNGLIDEVRVYNRALSSDEVKRLYKIGATAKQGVAPNNGTLASGLVGYWTFDGPDISSDASGIITAYDRSGNGNYGTSTTSQAPKTARGKIGQGLRFDGVSDSLIRVAANSSINTLGPMTVSAWIYPNTLGQSSIGAIATKGGGWWFRFNANRILQFLVFYNGGLSFILKPTANNVVSLNTWQHVLVTWDGVGNASGVRIFINGSETAYGSPVNPSGGRVDDSVYQLAIGNYVSGSMDFDGTIDEVRIYNRALSPDEIKRLYKIGATAKQGVAPNNGTLTNGLVGYWSFDGPDIAGVTAYDRSGQGNNGTLTNGPTRIRGKLGQALEFDGVDDYVALPTSPALTNTNTMSMWVYLKSPLIIGSLLAQNSARLLMIDNANVVRTVDFYNGSHHYGNTSLNFNMWYHVVMVSSAGSATFYLNGVPDGNFSGNTALTSTYIGKDEGSDAFNGLIDEVRTYNRALSPDEIKRLYNMGR